MVHALRQARRVLKDGGYLLDLRPAPLHRHIGIEQDGKCELLIVMKEDFVDDYAANRAVKEVIDAGLLKLIRRTRFDCTRRMDRFSDFKTWLDEYVSMGKVRGAEELLETVKRAMRSRKGKRRIVILGPVDLRVLVKQ